MGIEKNYEQLASTIAILGRSEIEERIRNFKGSFKFDFTDEYLNSLTVERLRHILFAALTAKFRKKGN
jgi:hypothetical protein